MSQRRLHSLGEAVFNNFVSFGIAYAINLAVLPVFRRTLTDAQAAFWLTLLFTIVSLIRQYFIRRLFNWWHFRNTPEEKCKRLSAAYARFNERSL